jgi:hypothetical protein
MNATLVDYDIRPSIGNQVAPRVEASGAVPGFSSSYIAYGGCLLINDFDSVAPGGGAVVSHNFMSAYGNVPLGNAGVFNTMTDTGGGVKQSLLFPYGFLYVRNNPNGIGSATSARTNLLEETLSLFGYGFYLPTLGPAVASPSTRALNILPAHPNPFNPTTKLSFTLGRESKGSVKIYNLRGALVRNLATGEFPSGLNELEWRGRDEHGSSVASGVYIVHYAIDGFDESRKIVMVK